MEDDSGSGVNLRMITEDSPNRDLATLALHDNKLYLFGGRDAIGAASHFIYCCSINSPDRNSAWELVEFSGDSPMPRWGHSAVVWGQQLWVLGGQNSSVESMEDMYRFDFVNRRWLGVDQRGDVPNRNFARSPYNNFHHVATHGSRMLAFGLLASGKRSVRLKLHEFDYCAGEWRRIPTSGCFTLDRLEGMAVHEHVLYAIGWEVRMSDKGLQVWRLHLVEHGMHWECIPVQGNIPEARIGCAVALLEDCGKIVVHGGLRADPGGTQVSADAFEFDIGTRTWVRLNHTTTTAQKADFQTKRHQHCAVGVPSLGAVIYVGGSTEQKPNASCTSTESLQVSNAAGNKWLDAQAKPTTPQSVGECPTSRLCKFCCSDAMSDVTLVCSGRRYPAHRVVLAAMSSKFNRMFEQGNQDCVAPPPRERQKVAWGTILEITDVSPETLESMLKHLYGCLETIPPSHAADLFSASDRYGLEDLRAACLSVLTAGISIEVVASFVLLANEHKCETLMQACIGFTSESADHLASVFASEGYLKLNRVCPELSQRFTQIATDHLVKKLQESATFPKPNIIQMSYVGREVVLPSTPPNLEEQKIIGS